MKNLIMKGSSKQLTKLLTLMIFFTFSMSSLMADVEEDLKKSSSEEKDVEIGIEHDKKLGKQVALDAEFTDSHGKTYKLRDLIDKPTILSLVYYNCPGICSPLLTNLGEVIDLAKIEPGEDYQVLSISFDPSEGTPLAAKWKKNYVEAMKRQVDDTDWRFMTGDSANIAALTESVGFHYLPDGEGDYIHSGALIAISPKGKITRYLLGLDYNPFDFKMAVIEASKGVATPPITKMLAYCFSYDPDGNKYIFNINKVFGTIIFLGAGIFLAVLLFKKGKRNRTIEKGGENG